MGGRIRILAVALLAIGVSCVTENDYPRRMLLQRSKEQKVEIPYLVRQPVSFLDNDMECVRYSYTSKDGESESPILAFVMTKKQLDNADQTSASVEHIQESVCSKSTCTKEVRIPKDGKRRPFYLMLVNADHTSPEFEQTKEGPLNVAISIDRCQPKNPQDGGLLGGATTGKREKKKSGVNVAAVVIPIIVILALAIVFLFVFIIMRRARSQTRDVPKDNIQAEREAPLTGSIHESHRKMSPPPPPIVTAVADHDDLHDHEDVAPAPEGLVVDGPIPPPDYEPPSTRSSFEEDRYHVYEEHTPPPPTQVYNNTLWGRMTSLRGSVKLRSMESLKESKGTGKLKSFLSWKRSEKATNLPSDVEEEDEDGEGSQRNNTVMGTNSFEEDIAPAAAVAGDDSSSDEDLEGGVAVSPAQDAEEEEDKKKTKVFVNNMYTRMMSSMSSFRSFGSIGSFGSRKRSSGVKMRTMNSMARWMGKNTLKKGQDDVPELPEGSENSDDEAELPQRQPMVTEEQEDESEEEKSIKEEEEEDQGRKSGRIVIPGAEHLSDSDSERSASPLQFQSTPISGRISE